MKDLKILITAVGSPGSATNIRYLKSVKERKIFLIGTDLNNDKIGKHWCDKFYTVPKGEDENFIPRLLEIIKKEKPDVLLPQSSSEVIPLSKNKDVLEDAGVKVLISSKESVYNSENKAELYKFLEGGPVKIPKFRLVNTLTDFLDAVEVLGYPHTPVCFKPPISKGTRGFRILRDDVSRKHALLNERPINRFISINEFKEIFENDTDFPELLVMQFVEGEEHTTDPLTRNGKTLLCPVKTRENERAGLAMKFVQTENQHLLESTDYIVEKLNLDWILNVQFIGEYLIELNPRISTQIFTPGVNIPYLAIKLILNEITEEDVMNYSEKVKIDCTSLRYFDQIYFS